MSLHLALDQIQRPSFFGQIYAAEERANNTFAHRAKIGGEKHLEVIAALKSSKKPVTSDWLSEYTGYTVQSVRHSMLKLCESGDARKIVTPEGRVVWELIK